MQFYNHRRLHGSLNNNTPASVWNQYDELLLNKEQQYKNDPEALSTNGERRSLKIEESRLVDKVFKKQKFASFDP
jgi:hypothetical protein